MMSVKKKISASERVRKCDPLWVNFGWVDLKDDPAKFKGK